MVPVRSRRHFALALYLVAAAACTSAEQQSSGGVPTLASSSVVPATAAEPVPTTISTSPAAVVSRGNPSKRMVALTFDAGADTGFTAQILDTLAAEGVKASFGLTGKWAEQNPALVSRIGADGHQVVNHTWDHQSFTGVSAKPAVTSSSARREQLDRTEAILRRLTAQTSQPWFRPPYGDYNASVNAGYGFGTLSEVVGDSPTARPPTPAGPVPRRW